MKYDSSMTHFHGDIIAALRYMLKDDSEITEKFSPKDGSPAPLRDYLKLNYGKPYSSHVGNGMRYSCNFSKGLELTFNSIINNSDYKYLTLSWSQVTKFIRDNWDEVFKKSETEEIPPSPQLSYIDKLRERYPKINETDEWVWGVYCPSSLFSGKNIPDTLDSLCDRNENGCKECWNSRCEADVTFDNTELDVFEDDYFEHYPEEKADEQPAAESVPEEKAATKTESEWELTHLCNKFGEDPCEYFLQTDNEKTVLNGKALDICNYYCTSENKVRKIGSGGTWTGLSPKFCPKRRAAENGSAPESKPTYKDIFLEHYPDFDVSRFDEFAESLCVACCFDDGGAACPFPGNDECKTHWESECLFEWRDKMFEYDLETIREFLIEQSLENKTAESASEIAVAVQEKSTEVQAAFDYSELDGDTAKNLRDCETVIRQETAGYFTLLGAKFKEAQDLLANHANGTFEKWYTAMGFKRQTVYNLIQRYDFLGSPTIGGREDTFEALPLTLSYEVSKPDAPAELVEKVLDGDITTNAEYIKLKAELDRTRDECRQIDANSAAKDKEYERELKEVNRRAENAERDNKKSTARLAAEVTKANELERRIKELESRPVDVAVQQDAELLEELEELREENARLKDDSVKSMVIRLTLDEYDKLLEKLGGDPCLGHIIKHAKIIKL